MKTTTTYEERARKFALILVKLFANCYTLREFESAIREYNYTHKRKLKYANGVSRIAIIRADYVIKFDMKPFKYFDCAGNCASEQLVYEKACADGFEYLLAKTSVYTLHGMTFSIMPRINHVGDGDRSWYNYVTDDEYAWLADNVNDLHQGNVGYLHGKVCVIDYAWAKNNNNTSDEWSD